MTLTEYVKNQGRGAIADVARRSGISYVTVQQAASGHRIALYRVAKAISDATNGAVSVAELCEGSLNRDGEAS